VPACKLMNVMRGNIEREWNQFCVWIDEAFRLVVSF